MEDWRGVGKCMGLDFREKRGPRGSVERIDSKKGKEPQWLHRRLGTGGCCTCLASSSSKRTQGGELSSARDHHTTSGWYHHVLVLLFAHHITHTKSLRSWLSCIHRVVCRARREREKERKKERGLDSFWQDLWITKTQKTEVEWQSTNRRSIESSLKKTINLETFTMNDRGTALIVFLLRNPHLLEGG